LVKPPSTNISRGSRPIWTPAEGRFINNNTAKLANVIGLTPSQACPTDYAVVADRATAHVVVTGVSGGAWRGAADIGPEIGGPETTNAGRGINF